MSTNGLGKPGTTEQRPRWQGPEETRPRGYLPAVDGENASEPSNAPADTQYQGHPDFAQDAAGNKPPRGIGNSEAVDETEAQARHSEGVNPPGTNTRSGES